MIEDKGTQLNKGGDTGATNNKVKSTVSSIVSINEEEKLNYENSDEIPFAPAEEVKQNEKSY